MSRAGPIQAGLGGVGLGLAGLGSARPAPNRSEPGRVELGCAAPELVNEFCAHRAGSPKVWFRSRGVHKSRLPREPGRGNKFRFGEPGRAGPSRPGPGRARSRPWPSLGRTDRAEPCQAGDRPGRAGPSPSEPSWAGLSRARLQQGCENEICAPPGWGSKRQGCLTRINQNLSYVIYYL